MNLHITNSIITADILDLSLEELLTLREGLSCMLTEYYYKQGRTHDKRGEKIEELREKLTPNQTV